eukprot:CAMPEP_0178896072 /NCGR_PEP_ID=MMETSP0786-20121207/950_1 /TAXON_ID=186022 /ORGANISM="Thalassionema frauenfeldii, Strain CCMP 1798" /LENGTH=337 /DNA_ID=CAMNT_0020566395 /DNA_START=119 /DNA_END=1132 /DNA_ORIENTATION=-
MTFPLTSVRSTYRSHLPRITFPPLNDSELQIALCTSIRNEEHYLSEWLDYHLALGFSMIIISDNSAKSTLTPYNNTHNDRVRVFSTPNQTRTIFKQIKDEQLRHPHWHMLQNNACIDYLKQLRRPPEWLALFDVDEFLVLKKHSNAIEFMQEYVPNGTINVNSFFFGTSNHSKYLDYPVTQRFTFQEDRVNHATKSFGKLSDVKVAFVHYMGIKKRPPTPNVLQRTFGPGRTQNLCCVENGTADVAVFHHYYTRSLEEIQQRVLCGQNTCKQLKERRIFSGTKQNVDAWETLKRNLPHYSVLEEEYKKEVLKTYGNKQSEEYERAYQILIGGNRTDM